MTAIDLCHLGRDRVICCWDEGDVLVDPGPASCLEVLLEALGERRPRALALTHIHLDHAGAAGSLVARWPGLEVWVHERGAGHLAAPQKLLASAARLYGERMQALWGEVLPVPTENMRVLRGGERLGRFRVAATPGHASHHVAYLDESTGRAFAGDVAGVRIPPAAFVLAPTPPPDIDLEAWHASLQLIEEWAPEELALTHFGAVSDVPNQLDGVRRRLADWGPMAQKLDCAAFAGAVRDQVAAAVPDAPTAARYEQAAPPDQIWQGLRRYWDGRSPAPAAQRLS